MARPAAPTATRTVVGAAARAPATQPQMSTRTCVGIDTTGDGRADLFVSGVDRDGDGVPDCLQDPRNFTALQAAAARAQPAALTSRGQVVPPAVATSQLPAQTVVAASSAQAAPPAAATATTAQLPAPAVQAALPAVAPSAVAQRPQTTQAQTGPLTVVLPAHAPALAPARLVHPAPPQTQDPSYSRGYMDAMAAMGHAPPLPPQSPAPSSATLPHPPMPGLAPLVALPLPPQSPALSSATLPHSPTPGLAPPGPAWAQPNPPPGSALPVFQGLEQQWLQQHHTVATVTPQAVPFPVPAATPMTQADGAAGPAAPAAAPAAAAPPDRITYGPYNYRLDVESLHMGGPTASPGEKLQGQGWQPEGHQHAAVLIEKRRSRGIC